MEVKKDVEEEGEGVVGGGAGKIDGAFSRKRGFRKKLKKKARGEGGGDGERN